MSAPMIQAYKDRLCVRLSDTKHIHSERPFYSFARGNSLKEFFRKFSWPLKLQQSRRNAAVANESESHFKNRNVIQSAATFKCYERRGWADVLLRLDENAFLFPLLTACHLHLQMSQWLCSVPGSPFEKKQTNYLCKYTCNLLPSHHCLFAGFMKASRG